MILPQDCSLQKVGRQSTSARCKTLKHGMCKLAEQLMSHALCFIGTKVGHTADPVDCHLDMVSRMKEVEQLPKRNSIWSGMKT